MSPRVRLLTPEGAGGVAVLEVRGSGALACVARLAGRAPRVGDLALVRLRRPHAPHETGELLDEALVWAESEERCELHVHASLPLVAELRAALGEGAEAGQDAPRPELGLEQEALERLAAAPGESAARVLLDQAEGALRRALEPLLELAIEDEPQARQTARELLDRARSARALWRPPLVVLVGATNAGKSTLFNALVGEERVLVSEEQGTTRDAVRARAALGAWLFDLVDTAGERELGGADEESAVERAGQLLARSLASAADLVLRLVPAREVLAAESLAPERGAQGEARLASRLDEVEPLRPGGLGLPAVSALRAPLAARRTVGELLARHLGLESEPWIPGRAVPFSPEQEELLARLAADPDGARSALRQLLARG